MEFVRLRVDRDNISDTRPQGATKKDSHEKNESLQEDQRDSKSITQGTAAVRIHRRENLRNRGKTQATLARNEQTHPSSWHTRQRNLTPKTRLAPQHGPNPLLLCGETESPPTCSDPGQNSCETMPPSSGATNVERCKKNIMNLGCDRTMVCYLMFSSHHKIVRAGAYANSLATS